MLATEGVRRVVISHWTVTDLPRISAMGRDIDVEIQLAGGVTDLETVLAAREAGAHALILGEALFTGAVEYGEATRSLGKMELQRMTNG